MGQHIISDRPYPLVNITGVTVVPGTRGRTKSNNTSYQVSDNMSYTHGSHSLKWGASEYRIQVDRASVTIQHHVRFSTRLHQQQRRNREYYSRQPRLASPGAYQTGAFVQDT